MIGAVMAFWKQAPEVSEPAKRVFDVYARGELANSGTCTRSDQLHLHPRNMSSARLTPPPILLVFNIQRVSRPPAQFPRILCTDPVIQLCRP